MTERKDSRSRRSFPSTTIVAAAPLALVAALAWAGGAFEPSRLSGRELTDALENGPGTHPGFRSAHAKGLCFSGQFASNGTGAALSKAGVFAPGTYPVVGRFSLGGGNPLATDGRNVFRAMALRIKMANGQEWRMAMDHTPIFPVATPAAFAKLQRASRPDPATGKPDPKVMEAYLAKHPETKAFQKYLKDTPLPNSFANSQYHSINAFRFTDGQGQTRLVRWSMLPETPMAALDKAKLDVLPTNFLFDDIMLRLKASPVRWGLAVTVADPADVTDNATVQWPSARPTTIVGTLTVTSAMPEERGACRDIVFDPTILPSGISPSDDPLLAARAAAYASSLRRRANPAPQPGALGSASAASLPGPGA